MCGKCLNSLLALLTAVGAYAGEGGRPPALLAFEEARKSIVSGRVEWSVTRNGDEKTTLSYVSRYAKRGDMIFEHRGDPEGWTVINLVPTRQGVSKYPQIWMRNADGVWTSQETDLMCSWWKGSGPKLPDGATLNPAVGPVKDVRNVGIAPVPWALDEHRGFRLVWEGPGSSVVSWEQARLGDIYSVTATCDEGTKITWEINPNKGWNAERITAENGSSRWGAVCNLKDYGGVWLPQTTDYFDFAKGQLTETVRIRSATVNQANDPQRFTPGDMGKEAGTNIVCQDAPNEAGKPLIWNGEEISSFDRWVEDVRTGKRIAGPTLRRMARGEPFESPYDTPADRLDRQTAVQRVKVRYLLSEHEGLWLKYVRDFIARYKLDEEQSAKAMKILADCQERAEKALSHHRAELMKLSTQLDEAVQKAEKETAQKLSKQIDTLKSPIQGIFDKDLKPRLDKIPTGAQREAAEKGGQ